MGETSREARPLSKALLLEILSLRLFYSGRQDPGTLKWVRMALILFVYFITTKTNQQADLQHNGAAKSQGSKRSGGEDHNIASPLTGDPEALKRWITGSHDMLL